MIMQSFCYFVIIWFRKQAVRILLKKMDEGKGENS